METLLYRSATKPIREQLSWEDKWKGPDKGLITCWEIGRSKRSTNPDLAKKAEMHELPPLGWKGGVEKKLTITKYGSLNYLAQWQGLRGEDLSINLAKDQELECSRTGMKVIFTAENAKYSQI